MIFRKCVVDGGLDEGDVTIKRETFDRFKTNCGKNKTQSSWLHYQNSLGNKLSKTRVYMINVQGVERLFLRKMGFGKWAELKPTDDETLHGMGFYWNVTGTLNKTLSN